MRAHLFERFLDAPVPVQEADDARMRAAAQRFRNGPECPHVICHCVRIREEDGVVAPDHAIGPDAVGKLLKCGDHDVRLVRHTGLHIAPVAREREQEEVRIRL